MQGSVAKTSAKRSTYEDYARLPEGAPYQLVDGELVMTPAPKSGHQRILGRLFRALADWSDRGDHGEVFVAPFDVILDDENVLQPDVLFVRKDRASIVTDWCRGPPDLVVEILSPSNAGFDRTRKLRAYARFGVPRFWIVDPAEKTLECLALDRGAYRIEASFTDAETATPPGFQGFVIELGHLWPKV
jgi:Uma2 family endonuclease